MLVIPVMQEAEKGQSWFEDSPGKKLLRPYLKNKPGVVAHVCKSSYTRDRGRRIVV
jgi:hypothetical protein